MFKERLIKLRKENKLSQYELANKLGFTRGQISNYELGSREPDLKTLHKIADFFQVTLDYLTGRVDNLTSAETDLRKAINEVSGLSNQNNRNLAMEEIIEVLKVKELTLNGKPIPEDKKVLIIAQLEATLDVLRKQE
ncbi:helix-turn-helix domain-containing protein [Thermoflavimicrobium daqui]|jgi:transcriptional regulator with XRE-family HTH domain|uniref:Transcriptional regulator n=1 Tax=Thermoflavimicrobium daqui TaxID=2137476 RepID=A0A364K8X3_9BACL|nr:helix-turn-helix domain-containing protein [Thermoflavimicrobium daqui]RAL26734.1 transcriptional regulator [Thermoflavimicrobium daqui]